MHQSSRKGFIFFIIIIFYLGFSKLLQCYQFNFSSFKIHNLKTSRLLKVMELEKKLMEQGQFEAAAYEKKVLK